MRIELLVTTNNTYIDRADNAYDIFHYLQKKDLNLSRNSLFRKCINRFFIPKLNLNETILIFK